MIKESQEVRKVIKNSGKIEDWDISKIRKQILKAIKGTDITLEYFESLLSFINSDTKLISTSDIQDILILTAKNHISIENPDMNIVAGRLASYDIQRKIWKNTKLSNNQYYESLIQKVESNHIREDILNILSKEDLKELGEYIKPQREYNLTLAQALIIGSKGLIKDDKGIIEYLSHSDMTNALILASNEDKSEIKKYTKEYYDFLSTFKISLGTAFQNNLRIPNGNTGSCFVGESDDNLYNLFKGYSDMATISKEGGGIGWYFGKVRPSGTWSKGIPNSNNISKWIKFCNDIVVAVNQKGVRKGAITVALDWWHLDIDDFMEMKSELNGDLRDKSFDIFPQIIVDSYFVEKAIKNEYLYKYNQYQFKELTGIDITELVNDELYKAHELAEKLILSGKLKDFEKINANKIWSKALWNWIEYGGFYITHKDNLNISNYLTEYGIAKCANLCVESFSLSKVSTKWITNGNSDSSYALESDGLTHSCSLISINIINTMIIDEFGNLITDDKILMRACKLAVRILDSSVDLGTMPILEAKTSSELLRNIGIGCVGVADYMAYHDKMYDTDDGLLFLEKLYEKIAYYCYKASIDLGKEKGSYPLHKEANYSTIFGRTPQELTEMSPNGFNWCEIGKDIKKYMRNFLLLAQAPNTSTALRQYCVASYSPAYSKETTQTLGNLNVPILPRFIKDKFWSYKTKFQYTTISMIKATTVCQRWIDTGISMELNLNPSLEPSIKPISDAILKAFHNKELKAVYYSITLSKDACTDCSN